MVWPEGPWLPADAASHGDFPTASASGRPGPPPCLLRDRPGASWPTLCTYKICRQLCAHVKTTRTLMCAHACEAMCFYVWTLEAACRCFPVSPKNPARVLASLMRSLAAVWGGTTSSRHRVCRSPNAGRPPSRFSPAARLTTARCGVVSVFTALLSDYLIFLCCQNNVSRCILHSLLTYRHAFGFFVTHAPNNLAAELTYYFNHLLQCFFWISLVCNHCICE